MREGLPPYYLELVADAALKSYWRHQALRTFVRRLGVKESFIATWTKDETKREFLNRLFPKLEANGDAGIRLIHRMADALVQQTSFPDLEDWEDSKEKKERARAAIAALKSYKETQQRDAQEQRDRAASRKRTEEIQEEIRHRKFDLQKLSDRLSVLAKNLGTQQAGYDFQDWFYDLTDHFEIVSRRPYMNAGRQIDGSLTVEGTTYLVELKFTREQCDAPEIDSLLKKVISKADNTMGILFSISGYSTVAISEASGPKTPLLLFDHNHIYMLLNGGITLTDLVSRVRRHCSQTGEAYLNTHDFGG